MPVYSTFVKDVLDTYLTGETLKALLVDSTYDPAVADEFVADVVGAEISPSGYSRQTLGSVSVELNTTTGEVFIKCNDINFGTFTQTGVLGPVFYIDNGSDATNRLIAAAVDSDPTDISSSVACIFRVDPDQGIFLGTIS